MKTASICAGLEAFVAIWTADREQIPDGSVDGLKLADDARECDARFFREALAQRRRKIGHRGEIKAPLGVERVINLRPAIGRLAERHYAVAQFLR